jgi:hypothetical protein
MECVNFLRLELCEENNTCLVMEETYLRPTRILLQEFQEMSSAFMHTLMNYVGEF